MHPADLGEGDILGDNWTSLTLPVWPEGSSPPLLRIILDLMCTFVVHQAHFTSILPWRSLSWCCRPFLARSEEAAKATSEGWGSWDGETTSTIAAALRVPGSSICPIWATLINYFDTDSELSIEEKNPVTFRGNRQSCRHRLTTRCRTRVLLSVPAAY